MQKLIWIVASCLLAACATPTPYFEREGAALIPSTIKWQPMGLNYEISGLVQDGAGLRTEARVAATDCEDGYGSLNYSTAVVLNGSTRADQIFTQLCNTAIPAINEYHSKITPEVRRAQAAGVLMGIQMGQQHATPPPAPSQSQTMECESVPGAPNDKVRCVKK